MKTLVFYLPMITNNRLPLLDFWLCAGFNANFILNFVSFIFKWRKLWNAKLNWIGRLISQHIANNYRYAKRWNRSQVTVVKPKKSRTGNYSVRVSGSDYAHDKWHLSKQLISCKFSTNNPKKKWHEDVTTSIKKKIASFQGLKIIFHAH